MKIALLLIAALGLAAEPVRIIFDTDMGNDIDDALALAVLHAFESRGEAKLLAVTLTLLIVASAPVRTSRPLAAWIVAAAAAARIERGLQAGLRLSAAAAVACVRGQGAQAQGLIQVVQVIGRAQPSFGVVMLGGGATQQSTITQRQHITLSGHRRKRC